MTTNKEQHICPYAAALSDDEDASFLNTTDSSSSLHQQHTTHDGTPAHHGATSPTTSILNEAKLKCPGKVPRLVLLYIVCIRVVNIKYLLLWLPSF